jgi:hypothetical protein
MKEQQTLTFSYLYGSHSQKLIQSLLPSQFLLTILRAAKSNGGNGTNRVFVTPQRACIESGGSSTPASSFYSIRKLHGSRFDLVDWEMRKNPICSRPWIEEEALAKEYFKISATTRAGHPEDSC